jgi:hypothetical protein
LSLLRVLPCAADAAVMTLIVDIMLFSRAAFVLRMHRSDESCVVAELNWRELFHARSMKLLHCRRSNLLPKLLPKLLPIPVPMFSMLPLLPPATLARLLLLKCLFFIRINLSIRNAARLQSEGVRGNRRHSSHFSVETMTRRGSHGLCVFGNISCKQMVAHKVVVDLIEVQLFILYQDVLISLVDTGRILTE